jgi:hypothetical protein
MSEKLRHYRVFKIKGNGDLEPMGTYIGRTPQDAVIKMAEQGNLRGPEWAMKYYAIPLTKMWQAYRPSYSDSSEI